MKIRSGFVSNSSSSSFVCIAKPGVIAKVLQDEDDVTKKVALSILNPKRADKITLDGNTYEMWQEIISTEEFGCDCDLNEDEYEIAYDKWIHFTNKLSKTKNVVVSDTGC
jgi:hypothetical protein